MSGMEWYLQPGENTLLLVAVDGSAAQTPGAYPCRVVGSFTPPPASAPGESERQIGQLLARIGIPRNLLGYTYLHTGLSLLLADPSLGRTLTRSLYPQIAARHQTSASGVERAIRHAIAQTFARDGSAGYRLALGRLASPVGEKPTNAEFLAQAAERLRLGA